MINPCSLCSATCCKTYLINVTSFDIVRISKYTKKEPREFAMLHPLKTLNYDPDLVLDTTDGCGSYLLGLKSHPCIFLGKDDLCTIYGSAPLSCRRYPYTLSDKINTRFCPLPSQLLFRVKGADIASSSLVSELIRYKSIVKEWNKKLGKESECLDFLVNNAAL